MLHTQRHTVPHSRPQIICFETQKQLIDKAVVPVIENALGKIFVLQDPVCDSGLLIVDEKPTILHARWALDLLDWKSIDCRLLLRWDIGPEIPRGNSNLF